MPSWKRVIVSGSAASLQSLYVSGSITGSSLLLNGTTAGSTLLDIQGTQGQLFSITDSLVGDIFAVSDISGIPILKVNSSGLVTVDGDLSVTGVLSSPTLSLSNLTDSYIPYHVNDTTGLADSNARYGSGTFAIGVEPSGGFPLEVGSTSGGTSAYFAGKVGIGTTSSNVPLEVNGSIGIGRIAGGYTFREVVGGDERAGIHSNASNDLILKVGAASTAITILGSNNNTGIGTSSPKARLQVNETTLTSLPTLGTGSGAFAIAEPNGLYGTWFGVSGNGSTWMQSQRSDGGNNVYDLYLQPSGGNVGIGSSSPGARLDVNGNIRSNAQLISTIATGTAPLVITSTTQVNNLNVDLLDGLHGSRYVSKDYDTYLTQFNQYYYMQFGQITIPSGSVSYQNPWIILMQGVEVDPDMAKYAHIKLHIRREPNNTVNNYRFLVTNLGNKKVDPLYITSDDGIVFKLYYKVENKTDYTGFFRFKTLQGTDILITNGTHITANIAPTGSLYTWTATESGFAGTSVNGSVNYIPKFTTTSTLGNSLIYDTGTNIGIGTTNTSGLLHLKSPDAGSTPIAPIILSRYWGSTSDTRASSIFHYAENVHDKLVFAVAGDGGSAISPNQISQAKLVIQANGNVGIGTVSPTQRLHVSGNLLLDTNGYAALFSTYKGANSNGDNIFIGGGGQFSIGVVGETYRGSLNTSIGAYSLQNVNIGCYNTAIGSYALQTNTTGSNNVAVGYCTLLSNLAGSFGTAIGADSQRFVNSQITPWTNSNTSVGHEALRGSTTSANNTGNENTAVGFQTMISNTTGASNSTLGYGVLFNNLIGNNNVGVGYASLYSNISGSANTALGRESLRYSKAGTGGTAVGYQSQFHANDQTATWTNSNTSIGYQSLRGSSTPANNTGNYNTALGFQTLYYISTGERNTAIGNNSQLGNVIGNQNTSIGDNSMYYNVSGSANTALGYHALYFGITGHNGTAVGFNSQRYVNNQTTTWTNTNTSLGYEALRGSTTPANNTGTDNTAIGYQTLVNNNAGARNVGIGYIVLQQNTSGSENTAIGRESLNTNVAGNGGTAIGYQSQQYVRDLTTSWGNTNTSIGYRALRGSTTAANNTGTGNTVVGYSSMAANTTGNNNTAIGVNTLIVNLTGAENTVVGTSGLGKNTAHGNTAVGYAALYENVLGAYNVALGSYAGRFIRNGTTPVSQSSYSVFLGNNAYPDAEGQTNQIVIGYNALGNGSNTVTLGNDSITKTVLKGTVGVGTTYNSGKLNFIGNATTVIISSTRSDDTNRGFIKYNGWGSYSITGGGLSIGEDWPESAAGGLKVVGGTQITGSLYVHSTAGNNPSILLSDADTTNRFTTVESNAKAIGEIQAGSSTQGGLAVDGFSRDNVANGLTLRGFIGATSSIAPAIAFRAGKWNGDTSYANMASTEKVFEFENINADVKYLTILGSGNVGIGTTTPTAKLDVNGNTIISGSLTTTETIQMVSGSQVFFIANKVGPYVTSIGGGAGLDSTGITYANLIGVDAGVFSPTAHYANFIGYQTGYSASVAEHSNFLGFQTGLRAINADRSNFLGKETGYGATNAYRSNFLGIEAGKSAVDAYHSNFLGDSAGQNATSASYSTFLGYHAGYAPSVGVSLGAHNIIIGSNVSLPAGTVRGLNIGGVLFGTGLNSDIISPIVTDPVTGGRIGIGKNNPSTALDILGDTFITGSLKVTGSSEFTGNVGIGFGSLSLLNGGNITQYSTDGNHQIDLFPDANHDFHLSTTDQTLYIESLNTVFTTYDGGPTLAVVSGSLVIRSAISPNSISLYTENDTANIADTFADTSTDKSYIVFAAGDGSNDPGYIMHETSESETNEGVLHLCPSDDNNYGDYISIHGTNDADQLKLHTDGTIEGVLTLNATKVIATTLTGSLSGNATTATTLAASKNINGTPFNGSIDITTTNWGTGRTITIGNTGKSVNGSTNISWTLAEIGAVPSTGGSITGSLSITGSVEVNTGLFSSKTSANSPVEVYNVGTTGNTCAIVDYTVVNAGGTAQRSGTITCNFNNSAVTHTETSTPDLGTSTSAVTFTTGVGSGAVRVYANITGSDTWTIKTSVRYF